MKLVPFQKFSYNPTSISVFFLQLMAHASIVFFVIHGKFWHWIIAFFIYFLTSCLGMTITYHRYLSHQSFKMPTWFKYVGLLCATLGISGSALSWVAIHRQHHRFSDTEKDSHSPKHLGWFTSHFLTMLLPVSNKYFSDLMRDKVLQLQHKYYFVINFTYAIIIYQLDPMAVVYAWLVPAALHWNGGNLIVSTSHRGGKIHSDFLLGILVWGEGFHSFHHENPKNFRFHRFDFGGFLIEKLFADKNINKSF